MASRRGVPQKKKTAAKRKIVKLKFQDSENIEKLQGILGNSFNESTVPSSIGSPKPEDGAETNGKVQENLIVDRSGRKPRKWTKQPREVKSFTGFVVEFKSWVGGAESDYNGVKSGVVEE